MKTILFALITLIVSTPAFAWEVSMDYAAPMQFQAPSPQVNSAYAQQVGNTVYGSDGSTYQQIGNVGFSSDGTTTVGSENTSYGSDGTMYQRIGNTVYSSDGHSCSNNGGFINCY